ncbi:MAG: PQQ-dependent sugar dehydrogenase [Nitrososphaeraceae archaeon]|nr:PQQ-dependent sugar dehydrogenase [Nitrososphaeraceae archaeon]
MLICSADYKIHGQNATIAGPKVTDSNLKVELVAGNLDFPTAIDFLGNDDLLLTEKNTGNVYEIINGNITAPLIHLNVTTRDERGLLGLAISGNGNNSSKDNTFVYLYYTLCGKDKATDSEVSQQFLNGEKVGQPTVKGGSKKCDNYVYRYELDAKNNKLVAPKLIASLPGLPGPSHNGGKLLMDKEKNLFVTIGDLQTTKFNQNKTGYDTKAQNIINGTFPDGRGGILRITQDGKPVRNGTLGVDYPLNLYYAYGVKNSFGIGLDPVTDNLWDTENGPQFGDEINLVKPGFNSGWEKVQGIWKLNQTREKDGIFDNSTKGVEFVDFSSKGKYSNPEFVWDKPVAPTALAFLDSDKLGQQYTNDIFVGSAKKGTLFHFDLKPDRESLDLIGDLADLVYSKKDDSSKIVFGENFGVVTDLKVGPDGYLYVVSGSGETDKGAIYRIVPNSK